MNIEDILSEREKTYGDFSTQSELSQCLKKVMRAHHKWGGLTASQQESLEMIQHKIARIINGDPSYADSWDDIAGYARLR